MKPVIALVGRPNVGKSTLFNRLTRERNALVADLPGLTRDRQYGVAEIGNASCTLIDTGGLTGAVQALPGEMESQAMQAVSEANLILFLVDARAGLTAADEDIADRLRRQGRDVVLVVNKIDGASQSSLEAEFMGLGFAQVAAISAAHGRGMGSLANRLQALLLDQTQDSDSAPAPTEATGNDTEGEIRVAVVGRPNVGKSTLINRMLGEERQVVFDLPGTTRDSISIPFEREGTRYQLIDTAGIRRKGKVTESVEKFSVVKTLEALERAHVAILLTDAQEGLVDQDLHLLSYAMEAGTSLLLAVNKWDGLSQEQKEQARVSLQRKLSFAPWLSTFRISALHGTGVGNLFSEIEKIFALAGFEVSTAQLTRILTRAVQRHAPPSVRGRRIKLRYAHKSGEHPPRIVIHGNQTEALPRSYVRYLENAFRETLKLRGVPIHIGFKTTDNPYAGKSNPLTPRQQRRRKKMLRHVKLKAKARKRH